MLASETTSLPEVLGGCGLLFDPEDPYPSRDRWTGSVAIRIYGLPWPEKGRRRARFFSWRKSAEQTLRLYLELLGRGMTFCNLTIRLKRVLEQPR